jgi:hypothetical protein
MGKMKKKVIVLPKIAICRQFLRPNMEAYFLFYIKRKKEGKEMRLHSVQHENRAKNNE